MSDTSMNTTYPSAPSTTENKTEDTHDHSLMSLSFAIFLLAIVLYFASLFLPVFITQTNDIHGYWVLAMGWLGFVAFQFAWYAAPFTVLAVYVSRKSPQFGLVLSVIAIIMASEAFLFTEVPFGRGDKVLDYGSGFYVWYVCFYLVSLSILLRLIAWGKIVEESSPVAALSAQSPHQLKENSQGDLSQQPLVNIVTAKATRKIVAKEKIARKKTLPNWEKNTPPTLPTTQATKNIYTPKDKKKRSGELVKKEAVPPALNPKKKRFVNPPPLPNRYKPVISRPPPLPEKALEIAPFLDQ